MITIESFAQGIAPFTQVAEKLRNVGIILSLYDNTIKYKFEAKTNLTTRLDAEFPFGLPYEKKIAMALAVTQEIRNNHVDDDEIDFVNKFFNLKINRNDIKRMYFYIKI